MVTTIFLTLKTGGTTVGVTLFATVGGAATFFTGVAGRLAGTGALVLWMTTGFSAGLGWVTGLGVGFAPFVSPLPLGGGAGSADG